MKTRAPGPGAPPPPSGTTALDQDVSREVDRLRESYWSKELAASKQKRVLLVEGDDDRGVIESLLRKRAPTFETRVRVVSAGGRESVMKRMKGTFPHDFALVDRDTWTDTEVAKLQSAEPRLYITRGWCLENEFFNPDALSHLTATAAAQVRGAREQWIRAGALWWTLQRARQAQQRWQEKLGWTGWTYGSTRVDLALESGEALAHSLEQKIPSEVRHEAQLDVAAVVTTFNQRCAEVLALPEAEQWRIGVHGKRAFVELLVPAMNSTPEVARFDLAEQLKPPDPINDLIALLLG